MQWAVWDEFSGNVDFSDELTGVGWVFCAKYSPRA
jgi:hypothetical protein